MEKHNKHNKDKGLYDQLVKVGSAIEQSDKHTLESPFIDSIVGTLQYYGVGQTHLNISYTVLRQDKLKIYDFIGLAMSDRLNLADDPVSSKNMVDIATKLAKLYIAQKHVGGFGWWLRGHDLDIEEPNHCKDCIKSYDEWHNETPKQRRQYQEDMKKMYGGNIF